MNIYIYGNKDFKKEINELIKRSNLKFRMSDDDAIYELKTLNELKETILNTPDDIFLIDEAKIYTNNLLNKNLKFLKPKDAINKEFLKENGIGDLNVDSLDGLKKYLISKFEEKSEETIDDFEERDEIQSSIINIVEEAYNEDEIKIDEEDENYLELDDDLSSLLSKSPSLEDESFDFNEEESPDFSEKKENKLENILLELDEKDDNMHITNNISELNIRGEEMNIDDLNESDMLSALSLDVNSLTSTNSNDSALSSTSNSPININVNNADDLAQLLKHLSQHKTLEITVKVK